MPAAQPKMYLLYDQQPARQRSSACCLCPRGTKSCTDGPLQIQGSCREWGRRRRLAASRVMEKFLSRLSPYATLARNFPAVEVSSAASECVFSLGGLVVNKTRNRLSEERVGDVVILHESMNGRTRCCRILMSRSYCLQRG